LQKLPDQPPIMAFLKATIPFMQGRTVFIRLNFSTGDAMGMNMVTKATHEICELHKNRHFPFERYLIESNMAVDKKPSMINTILGRGKSVTAEVFLQEKVISRLLRTTAKEIDLAYKQQVTGGHACRGSWFQRPCRQWSRCNISCLRPGYWQI
jgi:hydroxymethylglutaryl-CoA reductase (NADPH)